MNIYDMGRYYIITQSIKISWGVKYYIFGTVNFTNLWDIFIEIDSMKVWNIRPQSYYWTLEYQQPTRLKSVKTLILNYHGIGIQAKY